MQIASKVKQAHFRLPQQFTIISNHYAVLYTKVGICLQMEYLL